jgi:hypothetical protein
MLIMQIAKYFSLLLHFICSATISSKFVCQSSHCSEIYPAFTKYALTEVNSFRSKMKHDLVGTANGMCVMLC